MISIAGGILEAAKILGARKETQLLATSLINASIQEGFGLPVEVNIINTKESKPLNAKTAQRK